MKALIWAAGLGTRLRPLTEHLPKAMVKVANRPMLDYSVETCRAAGITDIAINLHYYPQTIQDYFADGKRQGMNIHYSYEDELLENAGGLLKLKEYFSGEKTIITLASDNLSDLDLKAMLDFHHEKKALVTIATTKADDVTKYGIVATDKNGRIQLFQEKPRLEEAQGDQVATCMYIFDQRIFDYLPPEPQKLHFGKEVFPELLKQDVPMFAYRHPGYWNDVGNPRNYLQANFDYFTTQWAEHQSDFVSEQAHIDPEAEVIAPVVIAPGVRLEKDCRVGPYAIVDQGTIIHRDCRVHHSVIGSGVSLEDNVRLQHSILADQSYLYHDVNLQEQVLGQGAQVNQVR